MQFIYCVNSHGSKTAKIIILVQQSAPSRRLNVNVMLSNITFLCVKIGQSVAKLLRFFLFFNMSAAAILDF